MALSKNSVNSVKTPLNDRKQEDTGTIMGEYEKCMA
jgi:hypothetical protein